MGSSVSRGIFIAQRAVARPVVGGITALLVGCVPALAASAVSRDIGWNRVQASDIGWNVVDGPARDIGWNGSGA